MIQKMSHLKDYMEFFYCIFCSLENIKFIFNKSLWNRSLVSSLFSLFCVFSYLFLQSAIFLPFTLLFGSLTYSTDTEKAKKHIKQRYTETYKTDRLSEHSMLPKDSLEQPGTEPPPHQYMTCSTTAFPPEKTKTGIELKN